MATSSKTTALEDEAKEESENEVPIWCLANQGIKLLINNDGKEAEKLFLKYPDSLVMFAGYSFATFMDALMSFEEDKLTLAVSTLKEVEKRCASQSGWLKNWTSRVFGSSDPRHQQQSLAENLETQIILADSQVCLAILTFLQQDISGYLKGGWVLRKAWKVYQNVYKDILQLYKEKIGDLQLPDPTNFSINYNESLDSSQSNGINWEVPENPSSTNNGYTPLSKIPHSHSAILNETPKTQSHTPHPFISQKNSISSVDSGNSSPSSMKNNCSQSSNNTNGPFLKKSMSVNSALSSNQMSSSMSIWSSKFSPFNSSLSFSHFTSSIQFFTSQEKLKPEEIDKATIMRLMGAVCFGYGLFQLGISLLPPSVLRLTHFFGFGANRHNGIACLMYSRLGVDMRAPLATLSLLWYHTIVRPFYALDGSNVQAGVDASTQLLKETEVEFGQSSLFLFFRGRVARLTSDIPSALTSFQQAVDNANQREIKLLALHEVGWCHLIQLDYSAAENTFLYLKSWSRWSKSFYCYLSAICTGACENLSNYGLFKENVVCLETAPKGGPLDEFLLRRSKCCPSDLTVLTSLKPVYWKLLVYEMLYLWNALPSCSAANIDIISQDCLLQEEQNDPEPMVGIANLILGCCYCMQRNYNNGIEYFKKCLAARKNLPPNANDAHISAFAQYELGALLIKTPETKEEGKHFLQQISHYNHYDFEHRLNVRVHSLLKSI